MLSKKLNKLLVTAIREVKKENMNISLLNTLFLHLYTIVLYIKY